MGCSALRGKSFVPHNSPVLTSSDFRIILKSFLKLEEEEQIKIALLDASHTHTNAHFCSTAFATVLVSIASFTINSAFCAFCAFGAFWRVLRVLRVLRFKSKNIVANGFDSSPKPGKGVWPRSWKCNSTCDELYSSVY